MMETKVKSRLVFRNRFLLFPDYPTSDSQRMIVLAAFRKPKTMLEVSFETGILRSNICRFISKWQEQGKIVRVGSGICPVSKHGAGFYTSNF